MAARAAEERKAAEMAAREAEERNKRYNAIWPDWGLNPVYRFTADWGYGNIKTRAREAPFGHARLMPARS